MPRYPTDGKLRAQYEVHCCECQFAILGLGENLLDAERQLREDYGWKKIKGHWTCQECHKGAVMRNILFLSTILIAASAPVLAQPSETEIASQIDYLNSQKVLSGADITALNTEISALQQIRVDRQVALLVAAQRGLNDLE